MDAKETVKCIEDVLSSDYHYNESLGYQLTSGDFEWLEEAKEALEKQIPKKPTFEGDGYDDSGNIIYDTWICPCCGDRYEVDYERHNHCPTCGQAIDWSDAR